MGLVEGPSAWNRGSPNLLTFPTQTHDRSNLYSVYAKKTSVLTNWTFTTYFHYIDYPFRFIRTIIKYSSIKLH